MIHRSREYDHRRGLIYAAKRHCITQIGSLPFRSIDQAIAYSLQYVGGDLITPPCGLGTRLFAEADAEATLVHLREIAAASGLSFALRLSLFAPHRPSLQQFRRWGRAHRL